MGVSSSAGSARGRGQANLGEDTCDVLLSLQGKPPTAEGLSKLQSAYRISERNGRAGGAVTVRRAGVKAAADDALSAGSERRAATTRSPGTASQGQADTL